MHYILKNSPGEEVFMLGNEAIARGAIEAGVAFTAAYPGTPSSEIALNFFQVSRETDLYFEYSANEKVSLEMAAGAAMSGLKAMCTMKHVGLNVASDALMTLAYTGVVGPLVLIVADDPFMFSSQNEQDSRFYGKLSGLPILEPSSVSEAKEMTRYAFELSELLKEPVIIRTTTRINHSSGVVTLGEIQERKTQGSFTKNPFSYVCVPAVSRKLHVKLLENYDKALDITNKSPWNMVQGSGNRLIICNGVSYGYVKDALQDLGQEDQFKILRIGFSHPMPETFIQNALAGCEKALVVEEGEPYMEESVRSCAQKAGLTLPIVGKGKDLFSRLYEFDPAMVKKVIASYFGLPFTQKTPVQVSDLPLAPQRPPVLCAGCPHRASYVAIREVLGDDAIYPTDIGCYTLGLLPPLKMGDFLIAMGAGVGTAGAFARATGKKVVAFIGDSTFFHSGLSPLASAVYNNHDFTLMILDNGTTAMTGHQPHPGADINHLGLPWTRLSIENIVKGMGIEKIGVIDPFKYHKSLEVIKDIVSHKGISVLISRAGCPLYERGLPHGKKQRPFYVNQDKCKNHRDCLTRVACPAFYLENDKVFIDAASCTGCMLCVQICPENAILPVKKEKMQ
ncbi:MAG: indolepyruvate ferredoxin oxidoreductase subunit alpha [Desulfobacula sp.]|jgi:indolepyruvate ferredoxin oxidoreductase alpha subunit|nr:indolepyruvate ferredoxin oxidoreductase subunit alpha [Desulfobacula sp.]